MGDVGRAATIAVWALGLVVLTVWGNTDGAIAAGIGASFVVGVLVGRWWLPLGTLGFLAFLAATFLLGGIGEETVDIGHLGPDDLLGFFFVAAVALIVAPAAIGVIARKLGDRYRRAAVQRRPVISGNEPHKPRK